MKALLIDYSSYERQFLKQTLANEGIEVHFAENSRAGLAFLQDNPDAKIILLDWRMPIMDGLGFLRGIRQHKLAENATIVALTRLQKLSGILQALKAGKTEHAPEAHPAEELLGKIYANLDREEHEYLERYFGDRRRREIRHLHHSEGFSAGNF